MPPVDGPRVIDVGIPGFGSKPALWRRSWRDKIFPALANFKPDLIFVCAGEFHRVGVGVRQGVRVGAWLVRGCPHPPYLKGFDAHKKDDLNFRHSPHHYLSSRYRL